MGVSAFVLFDIGSEVPIQKISKDIKLECIKKDMDFELHLEVNDGKIGSYNYAVIANKGKMQIENLTVYIKNMEIKTDYIILDWYSKTHVFFFGLLILDFDENTKLFLDFSIIVLNLYPFAKLWIEENWFYTSEDLEKIKNNPFDEDWCYKNPKEL